MNINNKLTQYKLSSIQHEIVFQAIKDIVFESEREVDDLHIDEHDAFSVSEDPLFYEKQGIFDDELENFGVYNKLIKVWYYNGINPALMPPGEKVRTDGKIRRED